MGALTVWLSCLCTRGLSRSYTYFGHWLGSLYSSYLGVSAKLMMPSGTRRASCEKKPATWPVG